MIICKINNKDIFSKLFYLNFYLIVILVTIFIYQNPNITYGSGWINIFGHRIININSNGFSRYLLFLYIYVYVNYIMSNNINFYKFLILLAISTLMQGYRNESEVTQILSDFGQDLEKDGTLTDVTIGNDLATHLYLKKRKNIYLFTSFL